MPRTMSTALGFSAPQVPSAEELPGYARVRTVTLSPALVAANTSAEQTFTLAGLRVGDFVFVNKPTAQAGLGIVGCRVSAADTLAITFGNFTAAGITPTASQVYTVVQCSVEGDPT